MKRKIPEEVMHGTDLAYRWYNCRCDACRYFNAAKSWAYRNKKPVEEYPGYIRKTPRHGNRWKYVKGCRCGLCVIANREYQRRYMKDWQRLRREGITMVDPWIEEALK